MLTARIVDVSDEYVLNYCTKYVTRDSTDARHDFGQFPPGDPRAQVCEGWRFPIIDSFRDAASPTLTANRVTFVYRAAAAATVAQVSVVGTFAALYEPIPMRRVRAHDEDTGYFAVSAVVPTGEVHRYKFIVDGRAVLDDINPQRVTLDNGRTWSRFFTQYCSRPLSFEDWEYAILERLAQHILPFRTEEGQNFMNRYYFYLDRQARDALYPYAYRLDEAVGAANYVDCAVSREENHHLVDYKICIGEIDRVLRQRNPYMDPQDMPAGAYAQLYDEMAANDVPGWDYRAYGSPRYFWTLLRRHVYTGAFSHPKHGGNVGAAGWAYLAERFSGAGGKTLFDWRRSIEPPLGLSSDYNG